MSKPGKWLFAWFYHNFLGHKGQPDLSDPFTRDIRIPLIQQAQGDVLEIGAGDGGNLPFYTGDVQVTLIEPNPYMIHYLDNACSRSDNACIKVIEGFGEKLPFPDASFDTVITTHVLCSVSDQARVLAEVRRVLRPGGRFLFIEHVAAHPGSGTYRWQRAVNPLWRRVGDGCHLTRDTGAMIEAAGFSRTSVERFDVSGPDLVRSHISGWAEA